MRYSNFFFFLILVLNTTTPSFGQTVEWSSAAMACTPTASTLEEGQYVTTAGRVKFKKGKFGSISFVCPVSQEFRSGSYILKAHTSWTGGSGRTLAVLRKSKKDGYSIDNVLDANISLVTPGSKYRSQKSGSKQIIFDTKRYYYWVQLTIKKSDATGERAIHGVELIRQ